MAARGEQRSCLTHDGLQLPYRVRGEGPVVLFANGLAADQSAWERLADSLADHCTCVFWDYRGLTPGPAAAASPETHAADALSILDAEGAERASVIGWSMGAQVGLELLRRAPARVASLVSINGAGRTAWGSRPEASLLSRGLARVLPLSDRFPVVTGMLGRWLASPEARTWATRIGLLDGSAGAPTLEEAMRSLASVDAQRYVSTLRQLVAHDATDILGAVRVPSLFIAGDRDPFCSRRAVERCVNRVADAEYLVLPGGTHFVLLERPDHISLRVTKFLDEHGVGAAG